MCVNVPAYASPVYSGMTVFKQGGAETTTSETVRRSDLCEPENRSSKAHITVPRRRGSGNRASKQAPNGAPERGERRNRMVIALDKHKKPIGFVTEKRARKLMESHRACIYRTYPTVIIIKDLDVRDFTNVPSYRIKIDPGSKYTGIAIVCNETNEVVMMLQLEHRGESIVELLQTRSAVRRNRRNRETRYRRSKWANGANGNRPSKEGKMPPSVKSIGDNVIRTVEKLKRFIRITECSFEASRFDTQLMDDPDISEEDYQHGTLFGYELREYLMEHYRHTCQYCGGKSEDPVLEWEHMIPKSRGGTDSVRNATLSCRCCNRDKGAMTPNEWLDQLKGRSPSSEKGKELTQTRIAHLEKIISNRTIYGSDRYAAWSNVLRKYEEAELFRMFETVECSTGGRTKFNRETVLHLPKDHHYDALAVGSVPESGFIDRTKGYVLYIKAMGRGNRMRGHRNPCGIITDKWTDRRKRFNGLQTGDIVHATIPSGKYEGTYTGRLMIRKSGSHDIRTLDGKLVTGTKKSIYTVRQHADGYSYKYEKAE